MENLTACKRTRAESLLDPHLPAAAKRQAFSKRLGFFYLRSLDPTAQITTSFASPPGGLIRLWSDKVFTVGRGKGLCEVVFDGNRCISRRHCQFFLEGARRKLLLVDGSFHRNLDGLETVAFSSDHAELQGRTLDGSRDGCSLNGVFVNGRRIRKGAVVELSVGDEVSLACGNRAHCIFSNHCGFAIEKVGFLNAHQLLDGRTRGFSTDLVVQELNYEQPIERAALLLSICGSIMHSMDPISFINKCLASDRVKKRGIARKVFRRNTVATTTRSGTKKIKSTIKLISQEEVESISLAASTSPKGQVTTADINVQFSRGVIQDFYRNDCRVQLTKDIDQCCFSDGKTIFLNRLKFMDPKSSEHHITVSLPELFHPVGSLTRIFIATFTCDVSWFLSYCEMPKDLPMTIACHNAERCWSSRQDSRTSMPFPDYPNLVLVYPPFPDTIAFGKDRKKRGVGCHHPKLIVLQREENIRVIITSANLVSRQWNNITNTVWWQDFPRRDSPDCSAFFSALSSDKTNEDSTSNSSDFAAQLAGFIASLISDVSGVVHWIAELMKYDFGGAVGYLVASVPGIHMRNSLSEPTHILSAMETLRSESVASKFLGSVQASVVGMSHRFQTSADSNGAELKKLASLLGKCRQTVSGLSEVLLRRTTNISADANAVSVLVPDLDQSSEKAYVQLGFLPRDVAKWVAPLSDTGVFAFSAFIFPKAALASVLEGSSIKVELILYITQGPKFFDISRSIQPEHLAPLCTLLASLGRCRGLWRLEEVLCRYRWPESIETDFVYGSSSIGTSVCTKYVASFSAAAGKKSCLFSDSEESDPEWGRWTASHELKKPSLSIAFPTIERVKNGLCGIQSSRYMLAFSEKTWQRLRSSRILHDAIPHPPERVGYPMHVKVARRRFKSKGDSSSFGWIYCGSHNFSPAAWGQELQFPTMAKASGDSAASTIGPRLHICNYELGIIFVCPPPGSCKDPDQRIRNLDDINLPFVMPAPKYHYNDRPATAQAMREASSLEKESLVVEEELDEEIPDEEEETTEYIAEENEEEKIYAEMLWSQVDSLDSR